MYNENAWPETAPIQTFVQERERPGRVGAASIALLSLGGAALLGSLLHLGVEGAPGGGVTVGIPAAVMITLGVLVAGWSGFLARAVSKGVKWTLAPAQWTAGVGTVLYGLFGLLALPTGTASSGAILPVLYALLLFVASLGGLVAVICLLGRSVGEYFDPTVEPSPFQQGQPGHGHRPSSSGADADWVPPAQRQPPHGGPGHFG